MRVHQVLSGAGPFDAVTTEALAFRARFRAWGWDGIDVAAAIDPRMRGVQPLRALRPRADDVVLVHYSAYAPRVRDVLEAPGRRVLLHHNVTPARWLWGADPLVALQCAVGRAELPDFVAACERHAADSAFNAAELREAGAREVAVVPILHDSGALGPPGPEPRPGPPHVLFVGRLMPHKRQDAAIRTIAQLPGARLTLVGEPLNEAHGGRLRELADELAPGRVVFERSLPAAALADRYRAAHAFLCLSEHEGFCVPVLEALHFGVPVVARPAGALPETAGDAALYVEDRDLAVVAELVALAAEDAALRAELRRRGRARLERFAPARTEAALRALLTG